MKFIDSSSVLLELISNPIKQYLHSRKDTMRCIINLILSEDDINIKVDIENPSNNPRKKMSFLNNFISNNLIENLSSDEDESEAEKWEPLPLEITRNQKICQKNKFADIISTLVYIFGSPEEFVEHYKRMLAERSVSDYINNFSIENEIKNLELLKLKFGENYFHSCEVLIKDVKESIKLNKTIQQNSGLLKSRIYESDDKDYLDKENFNVLVISKNYWPFKKNDLYDLKETEEDKLNCTYNNNNNSIINVFNASNTNINISISENIGLNNNENKSIINNAELEKIKNEIRENNCRLFYKKIYEKIESYKKAYSEIKTSRTLDFYSNLGFVDLDLSFNNGTFKFRVTPLSALIIHLFDDNLIKIRKKDLNNNSHFTSSSTMNENLKNKKSSSLDNVVYDLNEDLKVEDYKIFTVDFITDILKSSTAEVRKRLNFWVSKSVLREINLLENDENTFYFPNEMLANYPLIYPGINEMNRNEIFIYEEEIFNFEFVNNDHNKLNLENAVNTVLKNSGPKNFEQLLKKLVLSYKVTISEIKLKEILGKMTLEQKIFKEGEYFNILVRTD